MRGSMSGTNQRIDGKRLWDSLMAMAEIGATPKGGVKRLTLTEVDRAGRDRFRGWCEALGLTVRVDAIGSMFARRPGRNPSRPGRRAHVKPAPQRPSLAAPDPRP